MSLGQHAPAIYNAEALRNTKPADLDDPRVKELIRELQSLGYNLDIRKRAPPVNKAYARRYNAILGQYR